ncbi:MAG: hypothetical protein JRN20_11145 [Nitrososphaerota archaeon]|nr:hypothetical protein [Nitrososphaerota archaeon]MDG6922828.1 hypothetical protein [Nitrososphaerota archaeon]
MILPELSGLLQSSEVARIGVEEILSVTVILISLILLIVSLLTYKKTGLLRMVLVSAAFGLFAVKTLFGHFGVWILSWTAQTEEVASLSFDLVIVLLFFFALSSRR